MILTMMILLIINVIVVMMMMISILIFNYMHRLLRNNMLFLQISGFKTVSRNTKVPRTVSSCFVITWVNIVLTHLQPTAIYVATVTS